MVDDTLLSDESKNLNRNIIVKSGLVGIVGACLAILFSIAINGTEGNAFWDCKSLPFYHCVSVPTGLIFSLIACLFMWRTPKSSKNSCNEKQCRYQCCACSNSNQESGNNEQS